MFEFSEFDLIGDKLCKVLQLETDLVDCDDTYIAITHELFNQWSENEDYWPIWLAYEEEEKHLSDESDKTETLREMFIHIDFKGIPDEENRNKIEKLIKKLNGKVNRRKNNIYHETFKDRPSDNEMILKFKIKFFELEKLALLVS